MIGSIWAERAAAKLEMRHEAETRRIQEAVQRARLMHKLSVRLRHDRAAARRRRLLQWALVLLLGGAAGACAILELL